MTHLRRAKIVATVGPASGSPQMLRALLEAGVDTFRLNFSHGSHDDHARVHAEIRAIEAETGRPIGILQDLQGPKIRIGTLAGGRIAVAPGDLLGFVLDGTEGDAQNIPLPHPEIFAAVAPGQDLLIDDGRIRVRITELSERRLTAHVLAGGVLSNRKGVNLPGTRLALSPLTAKDRADLEFGLSLGMDWVALSFVQSPSDVAEAQALIRGRAGLVAKIEKPQALEHIDEIIALADAVMVARGDLGVEIPPEAVPGWQKELVRACRMAAKPVIVATQMLESMIGAPTPTRAEASDVATAIFDGADAVMLSAESATGQFPCEAVAMMDRIIQSAESSPFYRRLIDAVPSEVKRATPQAVAAASADLAHAIGAAAIVGFTASGATLARIARERPAAPILAITPNLGIARRTCLVWGASCVRSETLRSYEEMVDCATRSAVAAGLAGPADTIIVVAGIPFGQSGATNNLRVVQMGREERSVA